MLLSRASVDSDAGFGQGWESVVGRARDFERVAVDSQAWSTRASHQSALQSLR